MEEEKKKLEEQIQYEEMMYQKALEHPTHTAQFNDALINHRKKIDEMHEELKALTN